MPRGVSRLSVWIAIAALSLCGCGDDGDHGGTPDESECSVANASCKDSGPRDWRAELARRDQHLLVRPARVDSFW